MLTLRNGLCDLDSPGPHAPAPHILFKRLGRVFRVFDYRDGIGVTTLCGGTILHSRGIGCLPIFPALGTDAAGVECVPGTATGRLTAPSVFGLRAVDAFGTVNFDVWHIGIL